MKNTVKREYLSIAQLSVYCGVSERTLRKWLQAPVDPLPHFRIGTAKRLIRVRCGDFDNWMEKQRGNEQGLLDDLVKSILS